MYRWNWDAALASLPIILEGLPVTLSVALVAMLLSLPLAVVVALARFSPFRLVRGAAYGYTELFRTLPLLVVLTWFFFVPGLTFGVNLSPFFVAVTAFVLNTTAFLAEVLRGAYASIDPGQRHAAMSTGMTPFQTDCRVVLPQAFRRAIPVVGSMWVSLFRDSALVSVVGVHEMMFKAQTLAVVNYRPIEVLSVAALIYFVLTYPQARLVERLFQRLRVIV